MIPSPIDEHTCDTYTSGDCYLLAKRLSDTGVGRLTAVVDADNHSNWTHMAVQIGPNSYLDVEGIWDSSDLINNYGVIDYRMAVVPITDKDYDEMTATQHPGVESAEKLHQLAMKLTEWLTVAHNVPAIA